MFDEEMYINNDFYKFLNDKYLLKDDILSNGILPKIVKSVKENFMTFLGYTDSSCLGQLMYEDHICREIDICNDCIHYSNDAYTYMRRLSFPNIDKSMSRRVVSGFLYIGIRKMTEEEVKEYIEFKTGEFCHFDSIRTLDEKFILENIRIAFSHAFRKRIMNEYGLEYLYPRIIKILKGN